MSLRLCVVCGDSLPDVHRAHRRYCRTRCRMRALRIRQRGMAQPERAVPVDDPRARRRPRREPLVEPDDVEVGRELDDRPTSDGEESAGRDRPTPQQFGAYQALFDHFNERLFDRSLPSVLLTFSNYATQGYFKPLKWEDGQGYAHEIGMNPHYIRRQPRWVIAAVLVHDMCHLWQQLHGQPSRPGYHNREWAAKMHELGLIASDTGQPGGKAIGQRMEQYVDPGGAFQQAMERVPAGHWLPWQRIARVTDGDPSGSVIKHKYSCPNDHGNVWGKAGLWLICGHCRAEFQERLLGRRVG